MLKHALVACVLAAGLPATHVSDNDARAAAGIYATTDDESELARYDLVAAVGLDPSERRLIRSAWEHVFAECIAAAGYHVPDVTAPVEEDTSELDLARLRFDDVELISTYGYHWTVPGWTDPERTSDDRPEPPSADVEGGSGDLPQEVEDECKRAANDEVSDGNPAGDYINLLLEGQAEIWLALDDWSELPALQKAWAECMHTRGFPDERFDDPDRVRRFLERPISEAEIAYAQADSECRGESGYRDGVLGFIADRVAQWLIDHEGLVASIEELQQAELDRARAILDESSGARRMPPAWRVVAEPPNTTSTGGDEAADVLAEYNLVWAAGYSSSELRVIRTAWDGEFTECLAKFGYDVAGVDWTAPEAADGWNDDPEFQLAVLMFDDKERIGERGYHWTIEWDGPQLPAGHGEARPQEIPLTVEDECRVQAGEAFGLDRVVGMADEPLITANAEVAFGLDADQHLDAARQRWTDCMATQGFPDLSLVEDSWYKEFIFAEEVTELEIATALADSHCRVASGYRQQRLELLSSEIDDWLAENEGVVLTVRSMIDEEVDRAKALLSD